MKKIISLVCFLLLVLGFELRSQDIHFSQLHEAPLFINPANTGFFAGDYRAIANYRNQWASMGNPYQTMAVSVDGGLFKSKKRTAFLGLGLTLFNDKAGAAKLSNTQVNLNISGVLKLTSKAILSVGIYGGSSSYKGDYGALRYGTQFDGTEFSESLPSHENVYYKKVRYNDLGAGIAYEFTTAKINQERDDIFSFRIGLAGFHLNDKARVNFGSGTVNRIPKKYSGSLSFRIDIPNSKFSIAPSYVVLIQEPAAEHNFGTFIKYRFKTGTKVTGQKDERSFGVGVYYRLDDALIPQLTLDMGNYAIGLSYDVNISSYKKASKTVGGFEISLRWNKLTDALFAKKYQYRN